MKTYRDLEKKLWEKMDAVIDSDGEMNVMQVLLNINDDELIESMERDDLLLGLSGVDEDALDRIDRRREYIKKIRAMEEKIITDKEDALKRWIARNNEKAQKDLDLLCNEIEDKKK
jgi:hypothetical protein